MHCNCTVATAHRSVVPYIVALGIVDAVIPYVVTSATYSRKLVVVRREDTQRQCYYRITAVSSGQHLVIYTGLGVRRAFPCITAACLSTDVLRLTMTDNQVVVHYGVTTVYSLQRLGEVYVAEVRLTVDGQHVASSIIKFNRYGLVVQCQVQGINVTFAGISVLVRVRTACQILCSVPYVGIAYIGNSLSLELLVTYAEVQRTCRVALCRQTFVNTFLNLIIT